MKARIIWGLCLSLLASSKLVSLEFLDAIGPHDLAAGAEVYHLSRKREGGTRQDGWLYGGRIQYQRYKANGFYAAADASYAVGPMHGETSGGATLKSTMQEFETEGLLGWTLGFSLCRPILFTTYAGYGYYRSVNSFHSPSPLSIQLKDHFSFLPVGGILSVQLTSCLRLSVNFKARWMTDASETISGDPDHEDSKLQIDDGWLYSLELPVVYGFKWHDYCLNATLTPFWEQRQYGGRENFPFDFIETRYIAIGARLLIGLNF